MKGNKQYSGSGGYSHSFIHPLKTYSLGDLYVLGIGTILDTEKTNLSKRAHVNLACLMVTRATEEKRMKTELWGSAI